MLSYRHAFHAGNFADVLKHSVLTHVLDYMCRKDKGFSYIDSHAGAGMYTLKDEYAQKTGEYKNGIEKLINTTNLPEILENYVALIKAINKKETGSEQLTLYPGSPGIARDILRRQDNAHLFDLHPTDFDLLTEFSQRWKKSFIKKSDGYQGVLALVPPPSRRGVILIDPPYELKEDYLKAVQTIIKAYQKFPTGTYILWYPVVSRTFIDNMETTFLNSNVKNVIQIEYCQRSDTEEYGMTGTGIFIVNPPWTLPSQLDNLKVSLISILGDNYSSFNNKILINE